MAETALFILGIYCLVQAFYIRWLERHTNWVRNHWRTAYLQALERQERNPETRQYYTTANTTYKAGEQL